VKRYIIFIIILISSCKLNNTTEEPDNPPEKTSQTPTSQNLEGEVNTPIELQASFSDPDGDPINYKGLNNGVEVPLVVNGNTAKYLFNIDETGNYFIQIIGFNAYSDTAKWNITVGNTYPTVGEMQDKYANEDEVQEGAVVNETNYDDNEDAEEDLEVKLTQVKGSENYGDFNLALDDQNRIILENYIVESNGTITATLEVTDTHGAKTSKSSLYTIRPMDDLKGHLKNISTEEKEQGVIEVDGVLVETDAQGNFEVQMTPITEHILKAQGYNLDNKTTTIRKRTTEGNQDLEGLIVKVTPILDASTGVSEETFYNFAWEANFSPASSSPVEGLKKIDFDNAQNPDSTWTYWISKINPENGDEFTVTEQEEIADKIRTEVLASIPENKRPSIYIATADDEIPKAPESIWKPNKYGYCIIYPDRNENPGIGTFDENKDGIIENATIFLPNSTFQKGIVQECLSWLIAPNQVGGGLLTDPQVIPWEKSVLHTYTNQNTKQPADYLLEAIALNYKELTPIDEILGKGELK